MQENSTKTEVGVSQVISDLRGLFQINETKGEFICAEKNGKFYIDKRRIERLQVISMLQEYFKDKFIKGGYLEVASITLVYTSFTVKEGVPSN